MPGHARAPSLRKAHMNKKVVSGLTLAVAAALTVPAFAPAVFASPNDDGLVINEVYTRGGSAGASFNKKFVELYNPTDAAVSLDGLSLGYATAKNPTKISSSVALTGTIEAKGYYVVGAGSNRSGGTADLTVDQESGLNLAAGGGTVALAKTDKLASVATGGDVAGNPDAIDVVGWGKGALREGEAATVLTTAQQDTSGYSRMPGGKDTDNNKADFSAQALTPGASNTDEPTTDPTDPGTEPTPDPTPTADPTTPAPTTVTIAEIQGTGDVSPMAGQTVTTRGVVTAAYPEGGFNGVYIQTPGDSWDGTASTGLFAYGSTIAKGAQIGDYVEVTGKVSEFYSMTELTVSNFTKLDETAKAVPVKLDRVPAAEADREKLEGMLLDITGPYTVTNNYETNLYGEVGLAAGTTPLRQPSDAYNPSANPDEIAALEKENAERLITLDDGASVRYVGNNAAIPLPYISATSPLRVGGAVTFEQPLVLDYRNDVWRLQPTTAASTAEGGNHSADYVTFENTRAAAPAEVGGNVSLATFNVLNYFTSLGKDDAGASAYTDRAGNPITTKSGTVRGAWDEASLQRQQDKIVAAINTLDASVISLEEIENSATVDSSKDRDEALAHLVDALNAAAGSEKWAYVPSPAAADLPANEDVIRLAFIYQKDEVAPRGGSQILDNDWFSGVARQPLAQTFQAVDANGEPTGKAFVVIANHFKSKGSLSSKIANDTDTYQGNNNQLRTKEAQAVAEWADTAFAGKPVFIVGDLNSYSKEDPVLALEAAGYTEVVEKAVPDKQTYQFDGMVGSLDHVLANAEAAALVSGADVWNINAMESIALEYSRYNYNVTNFYDASPLRSSDHDPAKVGLTTTAVTPGDNPTDQPTDNPTGEPTAEPTQEPTASPTTEPTTKPAAPASNNGGRFFYSNRWNSPLADFRSQYGRAGDEVLVGDWNGDGITSVGVRRGNTFLLSNNLAGQAQITFSFGRASDTVLVGDWDGDGVDQLAVRRGNTFYLQGRIHSAATASKFAYGTSSDVPVAGDWNGDGVDTFTVIRGGRTWLGSNHLRGGAAEFQDSYGRPGDTPFVGDWNGEGTDTPLVVRG